MYALNVPHIGRVMQDPCAGHTMAHGHRNVPDPNCPEPQDSQQICLMQVTHRDKKIFSPHCFEKSLEGHLEALQKHTNCCSRVGRFFGGEKSGMYWLLLKLPELTLNLCLHTDKGRTLKVGGRKSAVAKELKQPQMDTLSSSLVFLSHNLFFLWSISVFDPYLLLKQSNNPSRPNMATMCSF